MAVETTYGVAVPVTRFFEAPVAFDYTPVKVQGTGTRPGKRLHRLERNVRVRTEASGTTDVEVGTAGFGILLKAVLGAVTSAQVSPGPPAVHQHVFTLTANDYLDSYTIQGVVPTLGSGASLPQTFVGCMAQSMELTASEGETLKASVSWGAKDMLTSEAAAVASYPTSDLFTFVHGEVVVKDAGTLTIPSGTALASVTAGTDVALSAVKSFSTKIDNGLDTAGYNLGGGGKRSRKQALGNRTVTGQMTVELTDAKVRDAYMLQKPLQVLLTFTNGDAVLQIVLPSVLLGGGIPKSNGGDVITVDASYEAFDSVFAPHPIWVVYRSTDTTP